MRLDEYYEQYGRLITQESERLFVDEFLYPILGSNIQEVLPQVTFVDRTGKARRIDFSYHGPSSKIALEVNGETYHAEGVIPNELFDENLFRQNEILRRGYVLLRFSYSQLQSPTWRELVSWTLRETFAAHAPELLSDYALEPNPIQQEALESLAHARTVRNWRRGVVVMPTGTGKTILSALDARRTGGRVLYLVHRLDILAQTVSAFEAVWGKLNSGLLTGEERSNTDDCDVLFASKDSLRQPHVLASFPPDAFDYVIVDEVHHGQSPTYKELISHFRPAFMLGMTATPDRTDRRDIFELFGYNKVYEVSLGEVIDRGLLVPYTYIGLTDDVDYSRIRYENQRYRVDDLERLLIIPERNEAILSAYLGEDLGAGDKAIGFCVSIAHADRMAEFFLERGVKAAAIHSRTLDRDLVLQRFRNDDLQVVFTVDLFNEGIDFPNVRVLLFLRPTESKTVFLQQLGRGLRIHPGKDRVRVLDFIGNYQRANQVRKYLATDVGREDIFHDDGSRMKKVIYQYSTGCEVRFDQSVEELLDRQDAADLGVDKIDLTQAYFELAEQLKRKPTREEIDAQGEHPVRLYLQSWGSWRAFLQDVGEYTEASYHYPQGTHLGHVLSILWYWGLDTRDGTHLSDDFIRMRGGLDHGRRGTYQRQLKYKLQAAMELGILEDDRTIPADSARSPELTAHGLALREALESTLRDLDLAFPMGDGGVPSSRMADDEATYNRAIAEAVEGDARVRGLVLGTLLGMPAAQQMIAYLFQVAREREVSKGRIYGEFFQSPFVVRFCEREGIEPATLEAARRRCPFLLNVLEACGIVEKDQNHVRLKKLILTESLVRASDGEEESTAFARLWAIEASLSEKVDVLDDEALSVLRELYGASILSGHYLVDDVEVFSVKEGK